MISYVQVKELLLNFEEKLLNPEIRKSGDELANLLSDSFIEFGSSGKIYNKEAVIKALQNESPIQVSIIDFNISFISDIVVLATYRAEKMNDNLLPATQSLRSSIWKNIEGVWQLYFHQGTVIQ